MQGYGSGPSNGAWVIGNAAVVESNNAPSINTLTKMFFIDFSPWCAKITLLVLPALSLSHTIH
jgi:hypothetical protein